MDPPADVVSHLRRGGFADIEVLQVDLTPTNYSKTLVDLKKKFDLGEIDCFINLCDGAWDEPSCGVSVVDLLQNKLNLPFTGADVDFFEPSRLQMKQVALACGALVPAWRFVYNSLDLDAFFERIHDEISSIGKALFKLCQCWINKRIQGLQFDRPAKAM